MHISCLKAISFLDIIKCPEGQFLQCMLSSKEQK